MKFPKTTVTFYHGRYRNKFSSFRPSFAKNEIFYMQEEHTAMLKLTEGRRLIKWLYFY